MTEQEKKPPLLSDKERVRLHELLAKDEDLDILLRHVKSLEEMSVEREAMFLLKGKIKIGAMWLTAVMGSIALSYNYLEQFIKSIVSK